MEPAWTGSKAMNPHPPAARLVPSAEVAAALTAAYPLMLHAQGHQRWWPAETPFEVCLGAILTQNTAWRNVVKALENCRRAGALHPRRLFELPERELADLLRPAGYFNLKARRVRAFLEVLIHDFDSDLERLLAGATPDVRARLLAIPGIGPETADSMLLYAGRHRSFVVDAYTRRIFSRHGWCRPDEDYPTLQAICASAPAPCDPEAHLDYWRDYHAQLVAIGKDFCRPRDPRCDPCPLRPLLPRLTGGPS